MQSSHILNVLLPWMLSCPPVVAAKVGHNIFVFALLHHGDLLLDIGDVIT